MSQSDKLFMRTVLSLLLLGAGAVLILVAAGMLFGGAGGLVQVQRQVSGAGSVPIIGQLLQGVAAGAATGAVRDLTQVVAVGVVLGLLGVGSSITGLAMLVLTIGASVKLQFSGVLGKRYGSGLHTWQVQQPGGAHVVKFKARLA